jgi:hypothetical protein
MLRRLAEESGIATPTAEDLVRLDRRRKGKRLSNRDWGSPSDPEDACCWEVQRKKEAFAMPPCVRTQAAGPFPPGAA